MGEVNTDPERRAIVESLSKSARNWAVIRDAIALGQPQPLIDQPLEITLEMIRGLRMVDETIIVHGAVHGNEGRR